jgi:hypothetical protein
MPKKPNMQKSRDHVLTWSEAKLAIAKRNAAAELKETKELIQINFHDYRQQGDGFGLLYLHDLLMGFAAEIRQHIDRAHSITETTLEQIEIARPGREVLKAEKKVTREI